MYNVLILLLGIHKAKGDNEWAETEEQKGKVINLLKNVSLPQNENGIYSPHLIQKPLDFCSSSKHKLRYFFWWRYIINIYHKKTVKVNDMIWRDRFIWTDLI